MSFRNQIVVLIRLSHPAVGGYQKTPRSGPEAEAFVYETERLTRRFQLFETICLPCLRNQSDQDFELVIVTGDKMPEPFNTRLMDLMAPMANARIVPLWPGHSYWAIRKGFSKVPTEGFSHRTTVRLDDDDGIDREFIARVRRMAERLHDPATPDADFAIAHNRGLYLDLAAEPPAIFDVGERLPLSIGLALTAPVSWRDNVYHVNHRAIATAHDLYVDQHTTAFLRAIHRDNDSSLNVNGVRDRMSQDQIRTVLAESFALDLDTLLSI